MSQTETMSTLQTLPSLQEPDKLGTLIQIRQSMDDVDTNELIYCSKSIIDIVTGDQLKTILFVGMNYIRHELQYQQLLSIKDLFKSSIENINKKEGEKNNNDDDAKCFESNIIPKFNVEKDASLSTTIPNEIISNYICSFLDLLSIYKFSKCDRNIAIICHSPLSINNLQFNYLNPYRYYKTSSTYYLDSDHLSQNKDVHLIRNVSRISIIRNNNIPQIVEKLKNLNNIKHLTIYQSLIDEDEEYHQLFNMDLLNDWKCIKDDWILMTSLESITFESNYDLPFILYILSKYRNREQHNIKCISFLNCHLHTIQTYGYQLNDYDEDDNLIEFDLSKLDLFDQYQNMLEFILPSKPNNLEILKFDKSYFLPSSENAQCLEINEKFNDIDRICVSLTNLKGIVFSELNSDEFEEDIQNNIFFQITHKILSNISLFNQLKSVHVHTEYIENELALLFINSSINIDVFSQINEICISLDISDEGIGLINNLKNLAKTNAFNITKLCLVIDIPSEMNEKLIHILIETIKEILCKCKQLELFQMVLEIQNNDYYFNETICKTCIKKLDVIHNIFKQFDKMLVTASLSAYGSDNKFATKTLISKFHIKSSHRSVDTPCDLIKSGYDEHKYIFTLTESLKIMIVNYLSVFFKGKIQFKLSWNINVDVYWNFFKRLLPLQTIFDLQHYQCDRCHVDKSGGDLHQSMDHMKESICIQNKLHDMKVQQTNPCWVTDCSYCDNIPWL